MAAMLEYRTQGYNPYAVKYSPYYDSRVAVAASANFGIVGNGRVFALALTAQGIEVEKTFDTNDALYDLAWSEINENQLIVACGDGSLKLFDLGVNDFPVMNFHEHKRETFSVCWNPITKDTFISSSWDGTVKIWSPTRNHSIKTLPIGTCTYSTSFCPSNPALISAVSSDSHLRIFDLRTPSSAKYHLTATIPVHASGPQPSPGASAPAEILTHDWNKYRDTVIATAGVDRILRTFDIRNPAGGPLSVMQGHEYAVRRLAWSPHSSDTLISASYDMTIGVTGIVTANVGRHVNERITASRRSSIAVTTTSVVAETTTVTTTVTTKAAGLPDVHTTGTGQTHLVNPHGANKGRSIPAPSVLCPLVNIFSGLHLVSGKTEHGGICLSKKISRNDTEEGLGRVVVGSSLAALDIGLGTLKRGVLCDGKTLKHLASNANRGVREDQPTLTLLVLSTGSSKTVNVRLTVSGSINLNNVCHVGEIHSTSGDIGREENTRLGLTESVGGSLALVLAHLGLEDVGWKFDKCCGVQVNNGLERELIGVLDRLLVLTIHKLKECGENLGPAADRNDVLGNLVVCERLVLGDGLNELKVIGSDHGAGQTDDTVGNSGGNEHGLSDLLFGAGKLADNFVEFSLETSVEHAISFIENQSSQVRSVDATARVRKHIVETAGGGDKEMATLSASLVQHSTLIGTSNGTLNNEASVSAQSAGLHGDLLSELSSR
ncbi:hypothetical protein HG531_003549 [Fusarium graminearum]|nr:hypothetical protein HG531_003549 [Fusarium graminearum]